MRAVMATQAMPTPRATGPTIFEKKLRPRLLLGKKERLDFGREGLRGAVMGIFYTQTNGQGTRKQDS